MPVFRSGSVVPFGKASQRKSEILPDGTSEGQVLSLSKRVIPDMFTAVTILFIWTCARVSCVYARIFVYPTCCWRYTSACVSCEHARKFLAPLAVSAQTIRRLCTFLRTRLLYFLITSPLNLRDVLGNHTSFLPFPVCVALMSVGHFSGICLILSGKSP